MRTLVFHWHLPYNHHQIKKALFIQCCAICSNPPIKILWLDLCNSFCIMGVTSNMATTPPSSNSPALTALAFFVRRGIRVWPRTQSLRPNQGSASVWRKKLKWAKKLLTDTFFRVCALHCVTLLYKIPSTCFTTHKGNFNWMLKIGWAQNSKIIEIRAWAMLNGAPRSPC